ncbi:MAG: hypothetical protein K6W08_08000, partial [Firmicutes bacterium]|nr:hypothetical protein [Bacillota bacterium]
MARAPHAVVRDPGRWWRAERAVAAKELAEARRDRRTVVAAVLLPALLMPVAVFVVPMLASRQQVPGGGQRTRLRWLPIDGGDPRELISLPSEAVPGSYDWSPDGERVAFLTRTGQLASLCLLGTRDGTFHYLVDLSRDDAGSLPFPPLAWSPDGRRLLYAALVQDRPTGGGWLFGSKTTIGLFAADLARPVGERVGTAEGQFPVWRSDGSVLVLARSSSGSLVLRQVEPSGESHDLAELPLRDSSRFAVRWDVAHAQALITLPGPASL